MVAVADVLDAFVIGDGSSSRVIATFPSSPPLAGIAMEGEPSLGGEE